MDKILRYLFILINLQHIVKLVSGDQEHLQPKFTSKCDDLCTNQSENGTKEFGKVECFRGCQYFNIEFLMNARNKDKIIDLNQLVERCGASCSEAYNGEKLKKEQCFRGCNEMMTLQAKAPLINGWLVYMGATDRNMVLLQPDFDIPSKEDWVLLDSMWRSNEYDYDSQYGNYDKITTQIETVPRYIGRENFTINYCIPVWMWILPLFLLVAFLYIHYSNYIYGMFLNEGLQHEFGLIGPGQVNVVPMNLTGGDEKKSLRPQRQEFAVGTDFYFYPSPAIPPPKYNDIAESILMDSSDDEEDIVATTNCNNANQKQTDVHIITAKKEPGNKDKKNSVVDI
ncbi:uncharacterized protein LOC116344456 [Contarinia nasturtii]|uniref:uncharacterized protein LOC116344456 n=1 Tax=Contarinia nasturtii TaxID=265458 RepID=UPI0012D389D8|nr:uncharacterized protein LOC116344456 [Contarinia nasturtii]